MSNSNVPSVPFLPKESFPRGLGHGDSIGEETISDLKSELSAIISGLVGGCRYGVKIRLPHAFLMTMLFKRGLSTNEKLRNVCSLVFEHSSNLAAFAALYKVWNIVYSQL